MHACMHMHACILINIYIIPAGICILASTIVYIYISMHASIDRDNHDHCGPHVLSCLPS